MCLLRLWQLESFHNDIKWHNICRCNVMAVTIAWCHSTNLLNAVHIIRNIYIYLLDVRWCARECNIMGSFSQNLLLRMRDRWFLSNWKTYIHGIICIEWDGKCAAIANHIIFRVTCNIAICSVFREKMFQTSEWRAPPYSFSFPLCVWALQNCHFIMGYLRKSFRLTYHMHDEHYKYIYFFINNNNNYDIVDVYFGRTQSTQNNRDSISLYYLHNWQCLLLARGAGGRTRPIGNIPPQIVQPTIIIARVYIAAIVSRRWELCNTPYVLKSELFVAGRCAEAAQRTRAKEEKKSVLNYYERDSHRRSPLCARYLPMLPNFIPFFTHTSFPRHVARLVSVQSFDILHAAPLCTPGKLLYVFLSHSLS